MNLFIANLSPASTTKDLQNLFSHYGIVTTVKVIIDRVTGRSKRYGFVEMPNKQEAREAVAELNNTAFQEKFILVRESQPEGNCNQKNDRQRMAHKRALEF
jgi:RNA recognition motif-containing protein